MADIKDILSSLLKAKGDVDSFKKSIESLGDLKVEVGLDLKAIRNVEKLESAMKSLVKAQEEMNEAEKKAMDAKGKNNEEYEKQLKIFEDSEKQVGRYTKVLKENAAKQIAAHEEMQRAALQTSEAKIADWKATTLAGKSYSALTSNLSKAAAGMGIAAMSMKALGRFTDAARLRNNIMIASYGSLKDNLADATMSTFKYEAAMRGAQATAKYLGMENEDVSAHMITYQRIVGKATPEALGLLTEATLATAKTMGITGAQAIDYVSDRMDNFGGTSQQALEHLKNLRAETTKYNTELAGVSIRGDDVVKTIQDITNSNNVYAVDQRFLAQTLMRTSATLQANGESYNYAQKMANNYTKSLSSEAPEWMKIRNSFDITKEVMKGTSKIKDLKTGKMVTQLATDMSEKLEKAKPGLSKKVTDLLNAGYSEYDTTRLLGETLGDTEVGMSLMSKKILELGSSSITTLASVYGKSYMEAEEMYKSAKRTQDLEKNTNIMKGVANDQQKKLREDMVKTLGLSLEEIDLAMKNEESQKALIELYTEKNSLATSNKTIEEQKAAALIKQEELGTKLEKQEANLAKLKSSNAKQSIIDIAQKQVDETKRAKDAQDALVDKSKEDGKVGDKNALGKTIEDAKKDQEATAVLTGDIFKSWMEKLSSPLGLLAAGTAVYFATSTANQILQNMFLAKIAGGQSATGAALSTLKEVATKGAGKVGGMGSAALGGLKAFGGHFVGGAGGLGSAGGMTAGGLATTAAGVVAAGYGGYKAGEALMNTDFGKKHLVADFDNVGPSDDEIFAEAERKANEKRKNRKKSPTAEYMNSIKSSRNGTPPTPSDNSRQGLVKASTQQNVQQAQAVQQAIQTADNAKLADKNTDSSSSTPSGPPTGQFGMINPDGSVNLVITDFMGTFGSALAQTKKR